MLETDQVDLCDPLDNGAVAIINASVINENLPENTLYLEKYSFKFEPINSGAPPIVSGSLTHKRQLPVSGMKLIMVESGRKRKYLEDLGSGLYSAGDFQSYSVTYTFEGVDRYGSDFGVIASATFSIGKYSTCAPSISPVSVSVTGFSNRDADATDDITFYISGGSGPYTVYSDDTVVIPAPGALAPGVSDFTIDPDAVSVETVVTLTVVDSAGAAVTAQVTVTLSATTDALTVAPVGIALTGIAYPELPSDPSDDVTIHISGGSGPYTVYSDNTVVIPSPGALGSGVSDFTIDPDSVITETVVTLTVVDSAGASVVTSVEVNP
jgi:hypothetical protein